MTPAGAPPPAPPPALRRTPLAERMAEAEAGWDRRLLGLGGVVLFVFAIAPRPRWAGAASPGARVWPWEVDPWLLLPSWLPLGLAAWMVLMARAPAGRRRGPALLGLGALVLGAELLLFPPHPALHSAGVGAWMLLQLLGVALIAGGNRSYRRHGRAPRGAYVGALGGACLLAALAYSAAQHLAQPGATATTLSGELDEPLIFFWVLALGPSALLAVLLLARPAPSGLPAMLSISLRCPLGFLVLQMAVLALLGGGVEGVFGLLGVVRALAVIGGAVLAVAVGAARFSEPLAGRPERVRDLERTFE